MNMHVPQSIQTAMELKYLAAIPHHMISPSTNSPIIKPSQDNLLGLFKITGDGVVFTQVEAGHLLSGAQAFNGVLPEPAIKNGKYIRWTGKQIYSVILPPISLSADPKSDKVPKVIIEYGIMKQGQVDKSVSGKILQAIHSDYGAKEAERYMNDLQIIISRYLIKSGFSVGVSDLVVHPDIVKRNQDAIKKAVTDEIELAKRVHLNILDDVSGNLSEVYEGKVSTIGGALDKQVINNTVNTLDYNTNRVLFMVTSGAKGSDTNIKQMMCCLGQQNIDGGRVPIGFTDRTLPHYPKYENGMESRGFIAHNFFEGLNPMEFYFHAMSGREGLIDTAVKTANSGYLQRRLVKTMEDLKTYHDYTIRDNSNEIIEFIYGNDGFDAVKIETQSTNFKLIKEEKLFKDFLFTEDEAFEDYMLAKSVAKMRESPNWFKKLESYNKAVQRCIDMIHVQMVKLLTSIDDLSLYYPVNMKKLVAKTIDVYSLDKITTKSELTPTEIIDELEKLIDDCRVNGLRNHVLEILVYDFMSPKKLIRDLHITRNALDFMLAQVRLGFRKGRVEAGEMVGPLAAQSIGERSTQLSVLGSECITLVETYADGTSKTYSGPIGKFIDGYFDNTADAVNYVAAPNDNTNAFINISRNISVLTVDPKTEKTNWKQISQISRHPANGGMVRVTTKTARTITTTLSHSHLKRTVDGIVPIRGDELQIGDRIPVVLKTDLPVTNTTIDIPNYGAINLDYDFGWFIGAYLSEGSLNGRHMIITNISPHFEQRVKRMATILGVQDTYVQRSKTSTIIGTKLYTNVEHQISHPAMSKFIEKEFNKGSINKQIPAFVFNTNLTFIAGLLRGYFDGDGNVTGTAQHETVRIHSVSRKLLDGVAMLLSLFGIGVSFGLEKKSAIGNYDLHTIKIFRKHIIKFYNAIGTDFQYKIDEFEKAKLTLESNLSRDYLDCLPAIGQLIADVAEPLKLPGYSRLYKRCIKEKVIGKETARKYINVFEMSANANLIDQSKLDKLKTAVNADVFWDEITNIEILPDPNELVYDIGVNGNHTFALNSGIFSHNTLNTFHTAGTQGSGKVTQGVPRLNEMLKVTKNPKQPSNIIYMTDTDRFDRERAERVKNSIEQTKIGQILKSDPAFYLEPTNKLDSVMEEDRAFMKFYEVFAELNPAFKEIPKNPWVIRLEFDRKEMVMRNVSMDDVHKILKDMYPEAGLMYSDDNAGKLVFRLRMPFETRENVEDDFKYLKNKVAEIKKIIIKGVDNIEQVYLSEPSKDCIIKGKACKGFSKVGEVYEVKEEYSMSTDGANLFDLLCRDDVDSTRTYSIDPNEMNSIFGIEAGKLIVEQQFRQIMTGSSAMTSPRHVSLLVDKMAHSGEFMSVDRHGISKEDIGPLAKCSFEKTPDELREAAIFGEIDKLKGVSANIMVGQIPECGTGTIKIFLDEEMLQEELAKRGNLTTDLQAELSEKDIFAEFQQKMCINEDEQININLKTIHSDGLALSQIPDVLVD